MLLNIEPNEGNHFISFVLHCSIRANVVQSLWLNSYNVVFRWEAVERESGLQLIHKCGTLDMARRGTSGYEILNKNSEASDRQGITYDYFFSYFEIMLCFLSFSFFFTLCLWFISLIWKINLEVHETNEKLKARTALIHPILIVVIFVTQWLHI